VVACCIRGDGHYGASIGLDRTATIWNCLTGRSVTRYAFEHTPSCCALSEDGSVLTVGLLGGDVSILRVENIEPANRFSLEDLRRQEEEVLGRLEGRSQTMRLTDVEQLCRLAGGAMWPEHLRLAAAERLILLGTREAYELDRSARCRVYAVIAKMASDDRWRELRSELIAGIHAPSVLKRLAQDADERIAQLAAERLKLLSMPHDCRLVRRNGQTTAEVTVGLDKGLGPIAAMVLITEVQRHGPKCMIWRRDRSKDSAADARSIMSVLALAATHGTPLVVQVQGQDEPALELALQVCSILASADTSDPRLDRFVCAEKR
jgi:phosphotransferase system HPr (HPr) family protein